VFDIIDVLDWRSEDKTGERDADTVMWFFLLHIIPDSEFSKFFACAIVYVWILNFSSVFKGDLQINEDSDR
jgi:hypothetical protein